MSADDPTIYVIDEREPVWKSAVKDAISFGCLVGTALALNTLMPPSAWINSAVAICWVLWLLGKALKLRMTMTPRQALAWIKEQYPEAAQ